MDMGINMISELELEKLAEKISSNEYIPIDSIFFPKNNDKAWENAICLFFGIGIIGFIIFILSIILGDGSDNNFIISVIAFLGTPVFALIMAIIAFKNNSIPEDLIKKAKNIELKIKKHNEVIFDKLLTSELNKKGIIELTKEIEICKIACTKEAIGVNDNENYLAYYKFRLNSSTGEISATVQKIDYSDLIKYEFIDNSTVTQTATSLSSSNSKKAIGGAITTGLLIGDTATGAIIGGSGQRKTETTFKTSVKNSYQIVIYLNSLEDSIITINTGSRNKINEIISMLEYILRNQNP